MSGGESIGPADAGSVLDADCVSEQSAVVGTRFVQMRVSGVHAVWGVTHGGVLLGEGVVACGAVEYLPFCRIRPVDALYSLGVVAAFGECDFSLSFVFRASLSRSFVFEKSEHVSVYEGSQLSVTVRREGNDNGKMAPLVELRCVPSFDGLYFLACVHVSLLSTLSTSASSRRLLNFCTQSDHRATAIHDPVTHTIQPSRLPPCSPFSPRHHDHHPHLGTNQPHKPSLALHPRRTTNQIQHPKPAMPRLTPLQDRQARGQPPPARPPPPSGRPASKLSTKVVPKKPDPPPVALTYAEEQRIDAAARVLGSWEALAMHASAASEVGVSSVDVSFVSVSRSFFFHLSLLSSLAFTIS